MKPSRRIDSSRGRRGQGIHARAPISALLTKHGVAHELVEHRLLSHWHDIVGSRIAARTWPDGLTDGVLWVRVSNSAWMHELSFLRDSVVTQANKLVGRQLVNEVRFHMGGRRAAADDPLAPTLAIRRKPAGKRPLPTPATGTRLAEIHQQVSQIEDQELRAAIAEARRKLNL